MELWRHSGIKRGYCGESDCEKAFLLARRTLTAAVRLKQSRRRYIEEQRRQKPRPPGATGQKPSRETP
jgi:hypothetical protein